jgi:hypothetical protein
MTTLDKTHSLGKSDSKELGLLNNKILGVTLIYFAQVFANYVFVCEYLKTKFGEQK